MLNKLKEKKNELVCAIKSFTEEPIENLGRIIPFLVVVIGVVVFLIAYISFIVKGGYANQIKIVSEKGIFYAWKGFTSGTSKIVMHKLVSRMIYLLCGIQFILLTIVSFKEAAKWKKIFMTVVLSLIALLGIATLVFWGIGTYFIPISEELAIILKDMYNSLDLRLCFIIYVLSWAVLSITFAVLLLTNRFRWMMGYIIKTVAGVYILVPLVLLLLENVIPLVLVIIALVVVMVIVISVCWVGSGHTVDLKSSNSDKKSYLGNNTRVKQEMKKKEMEEKQKKEDEKNTRILDWGVKAYKVHGIQHDYIATDNGVTVGEYCSLDEFRKGKKKLKDKNGKILTEEDLVWKK